MASRITGASDFHAIYVGGIQAVRKWVLGGARRRQRPVILTTTSYKTVECQLTPA